MVLSPAIEKLKKRIEDLELAINYSHDGLHLLDRDGNTILINKACEEKEGLSWDIVKDRTIAMLVEEGYLSDSATLKVLEQKASVTLIQQNKTGKQMIVTGTPVFDKDGEINRVIVNSRDITELNLYKKQLVETEMRLQNAGLANDNRSAAFGETPNIVCKSEGMKRVVRTAGVVAKVDSNVLITGESGTGKGLVSQYIHDNSSRKGNPFVKIDCGSIPDALFESELFGYEEGAFTGARTKGKIGLVELADGGTLFLDEVGELSLDAQSKLLRVIQDKEFLRIGGKDLIHVNVRIIAATNRNLRSMMENHGFREDLFYRLSVVPIHIPPLRQRRDDIHELILNVIARLENQYGIKKKINLNAIELLLDYEWKGNVRELENLIERICIISEKEIIGEQDLPLPIQNHLHSSFMDRGRGRTLRDLVADYERYILKKMLDEGKTVPAISRTLSVNVTTIRRKLDQYGLRNMHKRT